MWGEKEAQTDALKLSFHMHKIITMEMQIAILARPFFIVVSGNFRGIKRVYCAPHPLLLAIGD